MNGKLTKIEPGGIYTLMLDDNWALTAREMDNLVWGLNNLGDSLEPRARFYIIRNMKDSIMTDQNTETLEYIIDGLKEVIRLRAGNDT